MSPPPDVLAKMQEHGVVQPITAYVEAYPISDRLAWAVRQPELLARELAAWRSG